MAVRLAFCGLDEVDALVAFLRDHWGREHVLVTDRRVLDWQHRNEARSRYDALLAWDGDEIVGILGFIPTSRYDPALADDRETVWLTTWRARDDAPTGTGLLLLRGLRERLRPTWTGTVGLRPETAPIYARLGFRTGVLRRMILVDADRDAHHLVRLPAELPAEVRASWRRHPAALTAPLTAESLAGAAVVTDGTAPARSVAGVASRYLAHPFRAHRIDLVPAGPGHGGAVVVSRVATHGGARAVRVVDLVGDPAAMADAGPLLRGLLAAADAEWIDLHVTDALEAPLRAAGLVPVTDVPGLDAATRFEPFEPGDRTVHWALDGPGAVVHLVKADADHDRPNLPGLTASGPDGAVAGAVGR